MSSQQKTVCQFKYILKSRNVVELYTQVISATEASTSSAVETAATLYFKSEKLAVPRSLTSLLRPQQKKLTASTHQRQVLINFMSQQESRVQHLRTHCKEAASLSTVIRSIGPDSYMFLEFILGIIATFLCMPNHIWTDRPAVRPLDVHVHV